MPVLFRHALFLSIETGRAFWLCLFLGLTSWFGFAQENHTGHMAPSESLELPLNLTKAGYWVVDLDQRGIDLTLTIRHGAKPQEISVDSPQDEWGSERLLLLLEAPQTVQAILKTRETQGPTGEFLLQAIWLDPTHGAEHPSIAAERATTQAGMAYFENHPKAWQQAVAAFREEVSYRVTEKQSALEARALYCAGVLYRLLEKRDEAQIFVDRAIHRQRQLDQKMAVGFSANELGLLALSSGNFASARAWFEDAVEVRRKLGQPGLQGASQNNVCLTFLNEGRFEEAVPCLEEALTLSEQGKRLATQLSVHTNLGLLFDRQAKASLARKHYEAALKLQPASPGWGKARLHNNMGAFHVRLSNFGEGLRHYFQALRLFRELGEKGWEARVLNNLGNAYLQLDLPDRALPFLTGALPLRRSQGNQRGELATLINLGHAHESKRDLSRGLDFFKQAIRLAVDSNLGDDRGRANLGAARVLEQLGRHSEALKHVEAALAQAGVAKFPADLAQAYLVKGKIHQGMGAWEQALGDLGKAKALFGQQESKDGLIYAYDLIARIHRDRGQLDEAILAAEKAVALIEQVRGGIHLESLRRSFFARHHRVFTFMVGLKMAQAGHDEARIWEALVWSERGKAREFLELQHQALSSFGDSTLKPKSMDTTDLRMTVHAKARLLEKLRRSQSSAEAINRVRLELEQALHQLDRHELVYGDLLEVKPFEMGSLAKLKAIQNQLGEGTHLLAYHLGEKQSVGWHLTRKGLKAFELPGRKTLEDLVTQVYSETSRFQATRQRAAVLDTLGTLLFKPLSALEEVKRVILVPDGALHLVPFGVLPRMTLGKGVLQEFEITRLPSVTTFAQLQERQAGKRVVKKIGIFADPVYQARDARLPPAPLGQSPKLLMGQKQVFNRIPGTQKEAAAIEKIAAPSMETQMVTGLSANVDRVFAEDMATYSHLHFATHTQLDFTYPELSAMVLALVDEKRAEQVGHLYLHQLKQLSFNAELVVLSGCETAVGKIIRGEGLPGLARGFMQAGSKNVVASLWPVPDHATAAFMEQFYTALLVDQRHPAAALRTAQISLKKQRRYGHPFYWGGWVLFGLGE